MVTVSINTSRHGQKGAALLIMTLLLLTVAAVSTLAVGRVGALEQKRVGTAVRATEVYAAANGAVEYGVSWFEDNFASIAWVDVNGDGVLGAGDTAVPSALGNQALTADNYARSVVYTLRGDLVPTADAMPTLVEVAATATATADSHVSKTVRVALMMGRASIFSSASSDGSLSGYSGPPVVVEDCLSASTGNPSVAPNRGVSIGTTQGSPGCLVEGLLDINGGDKQALSPSRSLWDTVFSPDMTEADLKKMEPANPDAVIFVDASDPTVNNWHESLGSAAAPVILYFSETAGQPCPKINGGTTIYGIVYYADDSCTSQGFGGGTIYGTLAKAGDLNKFNANAEIIGMDLDFGGSGSAGGGGGSSQGLFIPRFSVVPGSWRDF